MTSISNAFTKHWNPRRNRKQVFSLISTHTHSFILRAQYVSHWNALCSVWFPSSTWDLQQSKRESSAHTLTHTYKATLECRYWSGASPSSHTHTHTQMQQLRMHLYWSVEFTVGGQIISHNITAYQLISLTYTHTLGNTLPWNESFI